MQQKCLSHRISVPPRLIQEAAKIGRIKRIFDCGSRDALDGLQLLKQLQADELHVFEPNPDAIALCRRNIAASNCADKVHFVPNALADAPGELVFYAIDPKATQTPHHDGNIGASSLYAANPEYPHEKYVQRQIRVCATTLNDYCGKYGTPDLLWMDVQGAEARVLRGASSILADVKLIHVEVSFRHMYKDQALFREVNECLNERFRLVELNAGHWPALPRLYAAFGFGPWVGDAIYVNRSLGT